MIPVLLPLVPSPLEAGYCNRITKILDRAGAWWIKTTGQKSKVGCPDIVACYRGRFIAIEVKNNRGTPDAAQVNQLWKITKAGGYAMVAKGDAGVESVRDLLTAIDLELDGMPAA